MKRGENPMLNRWDTAINCINLSLSVMHRLAQKVFHKKKGRGRKPKREVITYAKLIALKEFDKRTLRGAEVHLSRLVCHERIDHSVIAYWENKPEMAGIIAQFISIAGAMLDEALSSLFTFVDSTNFTDWNVNEINVTVCNRIAQQTVYPVGISFEVKDVVSAVREAVPLGTGKIKADAWYDEIKTIRLLFKMGYVPIICPNKNRYSGFYRRKAREIYKLPENRLAYKQRGRGESVFGSLTNCYGDRFNARSKYAMQTRIASRIFAYQVKLLIRVQLAHVVLIVRHAPRNPYAFSRRSSL